MEQASAGKGEPGVKLLTESKEILTKLAPVLRQGSRCCLRRRSRFVRINVRVR